MSFQDVLRSSKERFATSKFREMPGWQHYHGDQRRSVIKRQTKESVEVAALETIPSDAPLTSEYVPKASSGEGDILAESDHSLRRSKVTFSTDVIGNSNTEDTSVGEATSSFSSPSSIRRRKNKPKSTFSMLMSETQQFQKLVADLESFLVINPDSRDAVGECPEATWKARILLRSAQDADNDLRNKVEAYEKSLAALAALTAESKPSLTGMKPAELRMAQTSCSKLRRDYDRSHKALFSCLAIYERRQQAEVKQLTSVAWNSPSKSSAPHRDNNNSRDKKVSESGGNDFFDQAMRQRDLERLQSSMEKVSSIYQDLANLVNSQQSQINNLEETAEYAKSNVNRAAENIHCFYVRKMNGLGGCGVVDTDDQHTTVPGCGALNIVNDANFGNTGPTIQRFDSKISFSDEPQRRNSRSHQQITIFESIAESNSFVDEDSEEENDYIRVAETFHWMMPFETIREDMASVQNDILSVGKVVVRAGRGLNCGVPPD